jgi:hypothetical protein
VIPHLVRIPYQMVNDVGFQLLLGRQSGSPVLPERWPNTFQIEANNPRKNRGSNPGRNSRPNSRFRMRGPFRTLRWGGAVDGWTPFPLHSRCPPSNVEFVICTAAQTQFSQGASHVALHFPFCPRWVILSCPRIPHEYDYS